MPVSQAAIENFLLAADWFDARVAQTAPDAWDAPSPCEGWVARDVLTHVAGNVRALDDAIAGGDLAETMGRPVEGDPVEAWRDTKAKVAATLVTSPADLPDALARRDRSVPTELMIDSLMRDLVIHSWDLARAVGGDEELPADLVGAATAAMGFVTDKMRGPGLYGEIKPVEPDADAQAKLLALSGRTP